jgi:hypothetical protein
MIQKRFTKKKGDVSLFVILMMVSIMSIIMTSISNRSIAEINLSRQTFLGLQALQAANAGVEIWLAQFKDTGSNPGTLCEATPLPSGCTTSLGSEFFTDGANLTVSYVVTPITSGSSVQRVVGVGTAEVNAGGNIRYSITRSLEVEF